MEFFNSYKPLTINIMKKLFLFLALITLVIVSATVFAQDSTNVGRMISSDSVPQPGAPWTEWIGWAIGIVLFLFDVIRRIIPTWKGWTILGKLDELLDWIAKLFNGVGNKAKSPNGDKVAFKKTKVIVK